MILGVKKSSFWIYSISLIVGIALIIVGVALFHASCPEWIGTILINVGCGAIPTVAVAYFIERAANIREMKQWKKLRDSFLWGIPHGLLHICKTIVEKFYMDENTNGKTFKSCFDIAIAQMEKMEQSTWNCQEHESLNDLMNQLEYGVSLCIQDCEPILKSEFLLQINSVFSKSELLNFQYLSEECKRFRSLKTLTEMAECIELFVKTIYEGIPEVKRKLDRNLTLEKHRVKNWAELSK